MSDKLTVGETTRTLEQGQERQTALHRILQRDGQNAGDNTYHCEIREKQEGHNGTISSNVWVVTVWV